MNSAISTSEQLVFTGGTGTGVTELTAFDAALAEGGIQNANIIEVSSIIPRGADLVSDIGSADLDDAIESGGLYPIVLSKATTTTPEEEVFAAVSGQWLTTGHGVNVEISGRGLSREEAHAECQQLLAELAYNREEELTGQRHFQYESTTLSANADEGVACAFAGVVYLSKVEVPC